MSPPTRQPLSILLDALASAATNHSPPELTQRHPFQRKKR